MFGVVAACTSGETTMGDEAQVSDSTSESGLGETSVAESESDTLGTSETDAGCIGDECPCVLDSDCAPGETCSAGECIPEQAEPECGNGVLERGELCDMGAANGPGQSCNSSCQPNVCGDADMGPGEGCDDGNTVDDDECSNACVLASCGDGVVQASEPCDDGNALEDDACTNACTLAACGDGIVQLGVGEQCDASGDNNDHGDCTTSCQIATCGDGLLHDAGSGTEQCDLGNANGPNQSCLTGCISNVCGDGDLGPQEGCDDGGLVAGDGCSPTCVSEGCGNGILDPLEECDDGNAVADDDCTTTCNLPACGDGILQASEGETCDEAELNTNAGACTSGCQQATCGDGLVWIGHEQCDEGPSNSNAGACKVDCTTQVCGDGFVGLDEGCDDGNQNNADACTNACKTPMCGDGIIQAGEQCDDGIANGGAGCTLACTIPPCGCGYYHDTPTTCADQFPNVIFVRLGGPQNGDGQCWDQAVPNLQDALALAQPGDQLWVAAGTYTPGPANDRGVSFVIPAGVALYGGFVGNEILLGQRNWVVNKTILSGDIDGNGYNTSNNAQNNAYHVVELPNGTNARLDGFTIRGGYANGQGPDAVGAGAWVGAGTPHFANSLFEFNYSLSGGRGLHVTAGTSTLTEVSFENQKNIGFADAAPLGLAAGATVAMTGGRFLANSWTGDVLVSAGAEASLTQVDITNPAKGGMVIGGTLTLDGCTVQGPANSQSRGIEVRAGGHIEILGSTVSGFGQALRVIEGSEALVVGSTFSNNSAALPTDDDGAAIYAHQSQLEILDSIFSGNDCNDGLGAAIYTLTSSVTIIDSDFVNNIGNMASGVAYYAWGGDVLIQDSRFVTNQHGGLHLRTGTFVVDTSEFIGNTGRFGALNNAGGDTLVTQCVFTDNQATVTGAGISSSGDLDVVDSRFHGNSSNSSGGAIHHGSANAKLVRIYNSEFLGNSAVNWGGALTLDDTVEIANCVFSGNSAGVKGGAISMSEASTSIYASSFANNVAPAGSGSIYAALSTLSVVNSIFWDDTNVLWAESPLSSSFAQVCASEALAGTGNVQIVPSPYVDADGPDDMVGSADDDLVVLVGGSCDVAGDPALRPADWFDFDVDGNVLEPLPVDRLGAARVQGPMERGAYERP